MLFSTAVASLASAILIGVVAATPVEDWKTALGWDGVTLKSTDIGTSVNATGLQKRTTDGIYICADINWGKPCGYAQQTLNDCIILGSDWANKISSFGPDPNQECVAFSEDICASGEGIDKWFFSWPGDATGGLSTSDPWNDKIKAWRCQATQ